MGIHISDHNKVLHINLSNEKTSVEKPNNTFYRRYLGGRGIALYYLLKELKPNIDPLGPKNRLILANSVITGTVPGTSRFSIAAKSPLTGGYGESEAGGFFGPELKFAGYDAIVIAGRASKPVYLWINDGEVKICDANEVWGKPTKESQEEIRKELGNDKIRVALIGPSGEKLVRFACVTNDLAHANGRTGMGAVMGSKNLKAIAVEGTGKPDIKDPKRIKELTKYFNENYHKSDDLSGLHRLGTSQYVLIANKSGILPTRNFREGAIENAELISGETMNKTLVVKKKACFMCPVACKRVVKVDDPHKVDPAYGGPEYETIASLGSCCGITDLKAIAKVSEICNSHTLDVISTGTVVAFAMECFERGILTKKDTNGIELKFGNAEALVKIVEMIAKREGLGDLLANGVKRAAEKIGKGAREIAMHVKGLEVPMHEPRFKTGVGLGYAVSPTGADHLQMEHDPCFEKKGLSLNQSKAIGILEPVKSLELNTRKIRLFTYQQHWRSLGNCLNMCLFTVAPSRFWEISQINDIVKAVTGWNTTMWELMKVGERCTAMARVFNIREGFTKDDDWLPNRFFQPLESGAMKGIKLSKDTFKQAITTYYKMMGWDENGVVTKEKLEELDIGWVSTDS